jgi:hypothetical protein
MSELHVRRIRSVLKNKFDGLIDLSDVQDRSQAEIDQAFLTRSQAALALGYVADIEESVAAAALVDGYDDNGIDAIYFDEDVGEVYVVQSKWTESGKKAPDVGSIEKLTSGFRDLLAGRFDRFNSKVLSMQDSIERALDSSDVSFVLLIAYTGVQRLSEHAERRLADLLEEQNDPIDIAAYRILNQKELYSAIAGSVDQDSITIDVTLHEWGQVGEPYQAFYGQVSAEEIALWHQEFNSRLFSRNLRKFKGDTDVNLAMKLTLIHESGKFWYFNNGITVLCNRIRKKAIGGANRDVGQFTCEGVSVVNGAQTVGSIASAVTQGFPQARDSKVLVRFISLENCPPGFDAEVTTATNTQNRIERRDFASLDPEQERLRRELALDLSKRYAFKSGDRPPPHQEGCTIDDATLALACAYPNVGLAADAKRNISVLWADMDKPPYTLLFNDRLSAHRLWRCVEVLRAVDSELDREVLTRSGDQKRIAIHGNRFILHCIFRKVPLEQFDELDLDNISSIKQQARKEVSNLIEEIAEVIEDQFPHSYLNNFFKSKASCADLARHLKIPQQIDLNISYYAAQLSLLNQDTLYGTDQNGEAQ